MPPGVSRFRLTARSRTAAGGDGFAAWVQRTRASQPPARQALIHRSRRSRAAGKAHSLAAVAGVVGGGQGAHQPAVRGNQRRVGRLLEEGVAEQRHITVTYEASGQSSIDSSRLTAQPGRPHRPPRIGKQPAAIDGGGGLPEATGARRIDAPRALPAMARTASPAGVGVSRSGASIASRSWTRGMARMWRTCTT